jgi:UDP-N-acetylmuramoyl-L-alanyl-D-glutamate--2,6-diaminopimelate ligase
MTATRRAADLIAALRRADLFVECDALRPEVTAIATDTRQLVPGAAFVAVRGSQLDGHQFVAEAFRRGAGVAVVERRLEGTGPAIVVSDGRRAAIALAQWWYGEPSRRLSLVGVTGTSGKTTTTLLTRHLLNRLGSAGSIGTLGAFDGSGRPIPSTAGSLTTPGPVDLQATLAGLVDAGVDRVAMETSSHSLDQGRLDGLVFGAGIFTNLSREHLDYHRTMADYRLAKLRLLDYLSPTGVIAANADDPAWDDLASRAGAVTFGLAPSAQVRAEGVVLLPTSSRFTITGRFGRADVDLPLPGGFNVANALAASAAALGLGVELREVAERLGSAPQVPGRMERLTERPCVVIRDYAHKPDALERVLATLRPITPGRLICLFGCGGDRDKGKRPIMGKIAADLADVVVVSSDNPRSEDPERIIDDILVGIPAGTAVERRPDRRVAIEWALGAAEPGDTVVLAGKGHETYQIVGTEYLPFDERAIVAELIGSSA